MLGALPPERRDAAQQHRANCSTSFSLAQLWEKNNSAFVKHAPFPANRSFPNSCAANVALAYIVTEPFLRAYSQTLVLNLQMSLLYLTFDYSTLEQKLALIKQMKNVICSYDGCFSESKPLTVPKSIKVVLL